jgi:hypothetical protein
LSFAASAALRTFFLAASVCLRVATAFTSDQGFDRFSYPSPSEGCGDFGSGPDTISNAGIAAPLEFADRSRIAVVGTGLSFLG